MERNTGNSNENSAASSCGVSERQDQDSASGRFRTKPVTKQASGDDTRRDLHEQDNGWTVLFLDGGWELTVRREAAWYVSRKLNCTGFLFFVYDGDYWGYEMFRNGVAVDHFVQGEGDRSQEELGESWFPGQPCTGNSQLVAEAFPWLLPSDVEPYLVPSPPYEDYEEGNPASLLAAVESRAALNVPPRPGDEFGLFEQCAILNFLCLLRIRVELSNHTVNFSGRPFQSFWIEGQNTHGTWSKKYQEI